jgi:SAM-dependent methyltransferase
MASGPIPLPDRRAQLKEERRLMRDHNKAFCRLVAETFDCPGPVYEFGSYQVEGQVDYADLRAFFPHQAFVGCDMRPGPGVDRVEDVSSMTLPDGVAGTVLCIETFEHVFEVRRAFDEVFRILRPGGLFVLTSPFNFRIHGYPDDYWRMTPNCLRRMLAPYAARIVGQQGHAKFPHTVMSLAAKGAAPADFAARANRLAHAYRHWLAKAERELPWAERFRRRLALLYRSRGERHQIADYFKADFVVEASPASLALVG